MEKDKEPFSEKHPKLNMLFGLLLCGGFVAFAIFFVRVLFNVVIKGIIKLSTITSRLDAVVIVALITSGVSLASVIISSIVAKILEYRKSRQEYLTQKREKPYCEFIEMVYKIRGNIKDPGSYSNEQMLADLSKFSKEITLWGSSAVINKWNQFREGSTDPKGAKDNLFLLEEIMNNMRKDLGLKRVKKGYLLGFFVNDIKAAMRK